MDAHLRPPEDTPPDGPIPQPVIEAAPSGSMADGSPSDQVLVQWWNERHPGTPAALPLSPGQRQVILDAFRLSHQPAPPDGPAHPIGGREWAQQYAAAVPVTEKARFVDGTWQPQPDPRADPAFEPADDFWPDGAEGAGPPAVDDIPMVDPTPEVPGHLTRESLAAWYFTRMVGHLVRFDYGTKRWLLWSGHHWTPDPNGTVNELWRRVLARRYKVALDIGDEKARAAAILAVQAAGASDKAIGGGLSIASTMAPIATPADAWDRDPYLLGCENGVVDLRTGLLRDGHPEDLVSRSTGIAYDPEATCPRFERFLPEIFAGDQELSAWVEQFLGASLIGLPRELLGIHHGKGNNGKSVLMKTVKRAVGGYGVPVPIETLVDARRRAGAATPDLMPLRGARIAFMREPDQAAKLRGGTLKRLVSIDEQSGRALFGPQTSWDPSHTIHLMTNHLPAVEDADEGTWRRIAAIPYEVRFRKPGEPGDDPPEDPGLQDVLYGEAPGILARLVRGAVATVKGQSLWPFPAAVQAKTAAYRSDEDRLAGFIAARVVYEPDATVTRPALHRAYLDWCEVEKVPLDDRLKSRAFGSAFDGRGRVQPDKDGHERAIFRGARLRVDGDLWPDDSGPDPGCRVREANGVSPSTRAREESTPTALRTRQPGADGLDESTTPPASDGFCPTCGAGSFVSDESYERHWREAHAPEYARDDDPAPAVEPQGGHA